MTGQGQYPQHGHERAHKARRPHSCGARTASKCTTRAQRTDLPKELNLDARVVETHARLEHDVHNALDRLLAREEQQLLGGSARLALDQRLLLRVLILEINLNVGGRTESEKACLYPRSRQRHAYD